MSIAATLYDTTLGSGNLIRQLGSTSLGNSNQIEAGRFSAGVDPQAFFLTNARPQVSLQSMDIAGVLGILSPTAGLYLTSETILLPYQQRDPGGTFEGSSSHAVLNATQGLFVPVSASVNQGDAFATIDIAGFLESTTGFAVPVTVTTGQSLAAQAFGGAYGLGNAVLDGAAVIGHIGHTVNFGISVEPDYANGAIFPLAHFISERTPSIDIRFKSTAQMAAFTVNAKALTSLVVYFRHRAAGSTYVADATETHVGFSFADGIESFEQIQASGNQPAVPTLRVFGELLAVDTTSAITLP